MARPTNEAKEDELLIDADLYLSEIDDLDLVASNETIPPVGLTSSQFAVEPTVQTKPNSPRKLFPHSSRKVGGPFQVKSQVVVVNSTKSPNKNPSHVSRDKHHRRKLQERAKSSNNNKQRHRQPNKRNQQAEFRERVRDKLRVAVDKVKRSVKSVGQVRSVQFIANPPPDKHPKPRAPSPPVFDRLGPATVNSFKNYHIPKKTHASIEPTKTSSHSDKVRSAKPAQQSKPASVSHGTLSRTQIKNRNRRLAVKRMRAQLQQLQQSK